MADLRYGGPESDGTGLPSRSFAVSVKITICTQCRATYMHITHIILVILRNRTADGYVLAVGTPVYS